MGCRDPLCPTRGAVLGCSGVTSLPKTIFFPPKKGLAQALWGSGCWCFIYPWRGRHGIGWECGWWHGIGWKES